MTLDFSRSIALIGSAGPPPADTVRPARPRAGEAGLIPALTRNRRSTSERVPTSRNACRGRAPHTRRGLRAGAFRAGTSGAGGQHVAVPNDRGSGVLHQTRHSRRREYVHARPVRGFCQRRNYIQRQPARRPRASTTTGATPAVARYGAGWLAREIAANDGYLAPFGSPDVSDTAYAVLGLHATGVGRTQAQQAITFLQANLGAPLRNDDGTDNPGLLSYVIMAAVASGDDPYHFGGRAAINDLPRRLLATKRTSGPDAGLFGSEDPTYDGAFRQGTALAALKAAGVRASGLTRPAGLADRPAVRQRAMDLVPLGVDAVRRRRSQHVLGTGHQQHEHGRAGPGRVRPSSARGPHRVLAGRDPHQRRRLPLRRRGRADLGSRLDRTDHPGPAGQRRHRRPRDTRRWPDSSSAARTRPPIAARSSTPATAARTCWPRSSPSRPPPD